MSINYGVYEYNTSFYTGTESQPDTITVFIKSKNDRKSFHANYLQAPANIVGCLLLVGNCTGVARIVNAVKRIFNELSKVKFRSNDPHLNECWNAFKNLFRGLVEVIPFVGITLIIFDLHRNLVSFSSNIEKELGEQEGVAGIAIDGKISFTVNIEKLEDLYSTDDNNGEEKTDEYYLAGFSDLCSQFLIGCQEKGYKHKLTELFPKFQEKFDTRNV